MDAIVPLIDQLMQTAADDLRLAQHYIAQLGDVLTFAQERWSEASRINDAFGSSR